MKKVKISGLGIIMLILCWCVVSYAAKLQATIAITTSNQEIEPGETITFTMKLTNVSNAEGGIVGAIAGKIEYDKNFFENLTYTGITMNTETGKFSKMDSFKNNSEIGTIILKVKSNATGKGEVRFTELAANDGRDDYEEGEATTANRTITVTAKSKAAEENSQDKNNSESNNSTITEEENNKKTVKAEEAKQKAQNKSNDNKKVLPYTGNKSPIIIAFLITGIIGMVFMIKYKKYKNV